MGDNKPKSRARTSTAAPWFRISGGVESLNAAETALMEISSHLDELVGFWHDRSNISGGVVDKAPTNDRVAAADAAHRSWQIYQAAIHTSLLSISRSCDALEIDVLEISPPAHAASRTRHVRPLFSKCG